MADSSGPGSCAEFLRLNKRRECCVERDDECYMWHFDSRCYCDLFCAERVDKWSDCCPDGREACLGIKANVFDF